jgi:hypothetical protein
MGNVGLILFANLIRINKARRMRWVGHVARMGAKRITYRVWVGKQEGKRPLERLRRRWEDNIKIDLGEIGWSGLRTETSGELFLTWKWNFGFHRMLANS